MKSFFALLSAATLLAIAPLAHAVAPFGLNIDFGDSGGAADNTYGAAANQVGSWTTITATGTTNSLFDLGGNSSSASLTLAADSAAGFGGGAYAEGDNDYKLVNDNMYVYNNAWSVSISGLVDGIYDLYLYDAANTAVATGAFTANGIAHASFNAPSIGVLSEGVNWDKISNVAVTGGILNIVSDSGGGAYRGLAGLQLVAVPEPATYGLLAGVFVLGAGICRRLRVTRC